jgi:hypothetical protein
LRSSGVNSPMVGPVTAQSVYREGCPASYLTVVAIALRESSAPESRRFTSSECRRVGDRTELSSASRGAVRPMRSDRFVLLAVAVLAVAALAAGAATVEDVERPASTPVAEDGPTATPVDAGARPGGGPVPESTAEAACPNCPSTDWPGLLGLLGEVPGGPLAAVVAVLVLAGALSWHVLGREQDAGGDGDGPAADRSATVPDRGASASLAAEVPPADNEVYRAWRDLRERVAARSDADVAPLSPREVAATARRNELAADAAGELTALFRRVRYGDRPPTGDREHRAVAARGRLDPDRSPDREDGAGGATGDERAADGGEKR